MYPSVINWTIMLHYHDALVLLLREISVCNERIIHYYMDSGILLGTKTLVELIRHYIRDTVRVFSVCHA